MLGLYGNKRKENGNYFTTMGYTRYSLIGVWRFRAWGVGSRAWGRGFLVLLLGIGVGWFRGEGCAL